MFGQLKRSQKTKSGRLAYLTAMIKDYKVGALNRSSSYVVEKILKGLDLKEGLIMEFGAGDGVITREILKRMGEESLLIALETNKDLITILKRIEDRRLSALEESVEDYLLALNSGTQKFKAVISGIPFTFFRPFSRERIVKDTHQILEDGGVFIVYQNSPLMKPVLKRHFKNVETVFEPRNFLPYFIMKAKK